MPDITKHPKIKPKPRRRPKRLISSIPAGIIMSHPIVTIQLLRVRNNLPMGKPDFRAVGTYITRMKPAVTASAEDKVNKFIVLIYWSEKVILNKMDR